MGLVDWNAVWNGEILLSRRARLNAGGFWDEVAARDAGEACFPDACTDVHLRRIGATADDTVLEIGPGLGRLTIPLAQTARAVTAVDPSAGMLQRLRARADAQRITNLRTVHGAWEDVERAGDVEPHALVVASYSLFMLDMRAQLERMRRLATERVVLFVPAEPRMPEAIERILFGALVSSRMADHVLLHNLLHDLGIDADVEVLACHREQRFASREAAIDEQLRFHDAPDDKRDAIAAYLAPSLRDDGAGVVLARTVKTGVLRWRVA